jgi:threonine/homoserine/homoserine lactone efflux protein
LPITFFKMIYKGFLFGLLLQLAVGPICLYVLQSSIIEGMAYAEIVVLAVTLVDALYIMLAVLGMAVLLQGSTTQKVFKILGATVLFLFGVYIVVLGLLKIYIAPQFNLSAPAVFDNPFYAGLILTAANPLTILFWSGVFSSRISEEGLSKREIIYFSIGCVLATLLFLTAVVLLASPLKAIFPDAAIAALNVIVGLLLIYFAARLIYRKK